MQTRGSKPKNDEGTSKSAAHATVAARRFLRTHGATDFIERACGVKVAPATLRKLRSVGGGPKFYKAMGRAYYEEAALFAWVMSKRSRVVGKFSDLPSRMA